MTTEKISIQLKNIFHKLNLEQRNVDIFEEYIYTLIEWNKKINLISRKESDIVLNLIAPSLTFFDLTKELNIKSIVDLGSGAGFPALAIKIYNHDICVTMIEKNKKKASFLRYMSYKLNLKCCTVIEKNLAEINDREIDKTEICTIRGVNATKEIIEGLKIKTKSNYLAYFTSPKIKLPLVLVKEKQFSSISCQLYRL